MSFKQRSFLSTAIMIAGYIAGPAGAYISAAATAVGTAVLSAGLLLHMCRYRCPYCGKFPGREGISKSCSECGMAAGPDGEAL